jgi:hypothetical protein
MADKTCCINRALAFLGERPITNPDSPDTPAGKHICDNFTQSRREVLRRYPWNFAEEWLELDKTNDPSFGYANAYALPANHLRVLWVGDPFESRRDYRILYQSAHQRKVIAINNDGASKLKFGQTSDIELISLWDPLAVKVFALWMALDAAKAVTGQDGHAKMLNDLLTEELKDAVGVDGQEQNVLRHNDSEVQRERDRATFGWSDFTNVSGYY